MAIKATRTLKAARASIKASRRKKVTLYLNEGLYERFQRKCAEVPASTVVEQMMIEFVSSKGGR